MRKLKIVLNYNLKHLSEIRSLNSSVCLFAAKEAVLVVFREVREVCILALGKIKCRSYLGLEATVNPECWSCLTVSIGNSCPFLLPAAHLCVLLSEAPGSLLWFYLQTVPVHSLLQGKSRNSLLLLLHLIYPFQQQTR